MPFAPGNRLLTITALTTLCMAVATAFVTPAQAGGHKSGKAAPQELRFDPTRRSELTSGVFMAHTGDVLPW